ncbi:MAG: NAD+ synthase [Gemmatimonadota bacterium]
MRPAAPPVLDADFTCRALVVALAQTLADSGRTRFVVGLSGGVDSALAAALAARAAGADAVTALFLPPPATSPESGAAADRVAEQLGLALETVPLGALLAAAPLAAELDTSEGRARRGNLAARLRMAILYDRAAATGALIVGTGNKSELALGYTTLWGDMAADCWPLGDLYKTQVLALARALELPDEVLARAPSAELWEGQTDESELGFSYSLADEVLYYYLDERRRPEEIIALGLAAELVGQVLDRVRASAHKRRLPWVPKLSRRTIGHDFHHPRAWRGPA